MSAAAFDYAGPEHLRPAIVAALRRVVDPELALNIVELGLIYGIEAGGGAIRVRLTMTSAACPVAELICDDIRVELAELAGTAARVDTELVWDPPWSPDRMGEKARDAMGWD